MVAVSRISATTPLALVMYQNVVELTTHPLRANRRA